MKYDYLIVGAGLFGAVFAHEAARRGFKCLVVEKRNHIGGNCFTEELNGINVHKYGAHIFHTSSPKVWEYVNRFAEFNNYVNSPVARYKDEVYNLPFNMNTFSRLWHIVTPAQAKAKIAEQIEQANIAEPKNLAEQAISMVGSDIFVKLIKGYTEKQWGRSCEELPASIIKRLPVRFTYDNNYFNDRYQGIAVGGYTKMIANMLQGTEIRLNTDFFTDGAQLRQECRKIVFTGPIDEYYDYRYGALEYRSLRFETETLPIDNYQGCAVVNYTERKVPYTRVIEHKHFEFGTQPQTVITREYPADWQMGDEAYYTVNDEVNNQLYQRYHMLAMQEEKVIFGGRLAEYKYYDMDKVIMSALECTEREFAVK